jgi:hypothetical protein
VAHAARRDYKGDYKGRDMTNVSIKIEGHKAVIEIDLRARNGRSASGKTEMVASTHGNIKIPGTDVTLGLNAYVK